MRRDSSRYPAVRHAAAAGGGTRRLTVRRTYYYTVEYLCYWLRESSLVGDLRLAGLLLRRAMTRAGARLLLALRALGSASLPPSAASPTKPNIVFVLTDDQDLVLDSMRAMPFTTNFFGSGGASFSNAFAHTPVCCPSRGEVLTGRYLHNLKAADASVKSCMRLLVNDEFEGRVLGNSLQRAGYVTSMAGKYLNGKGVSHCPEPGGPRVEPPPGWDKYFVMCPDTCYVDCLMGDNGVAKWFNDTSFENGTNYAPSIIGNVTTAFIHDALSAPTSARKPFFAYTAVHSPHTPSTPAPWYSHTYPFVRAPRTASYNVSAADHHWAVAAQPAIDLLVELNMDVIARHRLQTLLTVDDMVREIVELVDKKGATAETYFFFTSDHGFHMGQHCLGPCKRQPYDTDVRIPLFVRGPGVAAGSKIEALVGHPDLAPTMLTLAGAEGVGEMDGDSMVPLLVPSGRQEFGKVWRTAQLLEYIGTQEAPKIDGSGHIIDNGNNTFRGLRHIEPARGIDIAYYEFTDLEADWNFHSPNFYELYNVTEDPEQMHNLYYHGGEGIDADLKQALALRVRNEYACKGSTCS